MEKVIAGVVIGVIFAEPIRETSQKIFSWFSKKNKLEVENTDEAIS